MRGLPGALSADPIFLKGLPGAQGAPTKIALVFMTATRDTVLEVSLNSKPLVVTVLTLYVPVP